VRNYTRTHTHTHTHILSLFFNFDSHAMKHDDKWIIFITFRVGHCYNLARWRWVANLSSSMSGPINTHKSQDRENRDGSGIVCSLARSQWRSSKSRDLSSIMRGRLSVIDYAAGAVQNESDIREGDPSRDRAGTTSDKLWRDLVFRTRDPERRDPSFVYVNRCTPPPLIPIVLTGRM